MIVRFKEYLPYYKRNLKVALPVMLTQLGASLVGFFDSIMVGHYATVDLAAVSFSNAIFFTVMVFAMGALMGITPLVGIQVGELAQTTDNKNFIYKRIASLFQNGILFTVLLSAIMLILLSVCIPFLDRFGQDPEVIEVARPYYILIVISLVPFLFFSFFKQFLEGLGNTMVAMVITLLMNGLNILLGILSFIGKVIFDHSGSLGAGQLYGVANAIAKFIQGMYVAIMTLLMDKSYANLLTPLPGLIVCTVGYILGVKYCNGFRPKKKKEDRYAPKVSRPQKKD